ncbi:MAG: sensor histidine kinase [Persicimonas sp.]
MTRLLIIRHESIPPGGVHPAGAAHPELEFEEAASLAEARGLLRGGRFSALMAYFNVVEAEQGRLDTLHAVAHDLPVICVVDSGDHRSAAAVVAGHAACYIYADQLRSPHGATLLRAAVKRAGALDRGDHLQEDLAVRDSELLGLNALASAVSSSLNRDVIIRRALWVFSGLCRRGATALVQIEPASPLADQAGAGDSGPARRAADLSLQCVAEFAVDGGQVCAGFDQPEWWLDLIYDDEIVILDPPPSADEMPALSPLLERIEDSPLVLVPLWGQGRAMGLLVITDLAPQQPLPFSREVLRAMASQLGGAIENARLFEEVNSAYRSLQSTQDQLVHAEKFAAMGVLAAEIAHEINNPASFVISNLSVMVDYVETIGAFLEHMKTRLHRGSPELVEDWETMASEHEIAFLREDLETLLSRSMGGMQRIHQIVQDLRFFSHDTANEPGWIDIESLLEATLNLARHEAKYRARLELDFDNIPQIFSDANRLSQVFLNLLVNAAHAIESGSIDDNEIVVKTRRDGDDVVVMVSDTGEGIPPEIVPHIFDPFFTTKEQGEGTGLGLSISRDIVRSLGGEISVSSEPGRGSTFKVVLPIRAPQFEKDEKLRDSGSYSTPPVGSRSLGEQSDPDQSDAGQPEANRPEIPNADPS